MSFGDGDLLLVVVQRGCGALRDRLDVVHVRGVLVVPALALARVDPEDETDHDRDRERHQAGEPRESHRPGRRRGRAPRAAPTLRPDPPARPAGRLDGLRLLEEFELASVVVGAHSPG